jgi:hypothetical protein
VVDADGGVGPPTADAPEIGSFGYAERSALMVEEESVKLSAG